MTIRTRWPWFSMLLIMGIAVLLVFGLGFLWFFILIFTGWQMPPGLLRSFVAPFAVVGLLAALVEWWIRAFVIKRRVSDKTADRV